MDRETQIIASLLGLDLALVAQNAYFDALRNEWHNKEVYDYILERALVTTGAVMINVNNLNQLSK